MKKNFTLVLAMVLMCFLSCQGQSKGSVTELDEDVQVELADSIANEIDVVIQDILEETKSTAEEIDSLLEGI